jgi:hypothetical protein
MLNILMTYILLNGSSVPTIISKLIASRMSKHVWGCIGIPMLVFSPDLATIFLIVEFVSGVFLSDTNTYSVTG